MSRFVIVSYTPKEGMENDLLVAVKKHMDVLNEQGLVTGKPAYVMRAEFGAACEYTPLAQLAESKNMFAEFDAVDL